ncbi:Proteasome activator complex subunit 4 [Galdieria sulphuraria]|nr:Proteasome activator complex subunit 4 [Galdieria sulphuraria]
MAAMEDSIEWQKPSEALPSSYKRETLVEGKEQLEALKSLAQNISHSLNFVYADLELLNNGTKRFLNLKLYKEFLIYSEAQGEDSKQSFSTWENMASNILLILQTLLAGILKRTTDAALRIKLARTVTKLLEKPKILGDDCSFSPPWKETLELLEEFHVRSFDGALFIGKEVREQHLRALVTLLLCFRYYLNSTCEEVIFSLPMFNSIPSAKPNSTSTLFFEKLDWENPVKAIEQLASASLIVPCHSPFILSWIPEAVSLWMKINTCHDWDRLWLRLFGHIAKQQPHAIDWTPYMHIIYDRIFSCFQISTREGARRTQSIIKTPPNVSCLIRGDAVSSAAEFIVYSLTPMNPSGLDLFLRLVQIIEPFYHPNHLEHNQHFVSSFLSSCTRNLLNRLSSERKATQENVVERIQGSRTITAVAAKEHRLTEQWIEDIVSKLYGLTERSLYSKSSKSTQEAANSIGNLCAILPEMVIPKLVLTSQDDFISLTMPHRTKASLKALDVICPILSDSQLYPQGVEYILQLLPHLLPCVDVNDSMKTKLAIDIVTALSHRFGEIFCDQTHVLEEFVLQWIERIIHFLENVEMPAKFGHSKISPLSFDTFGNFCEVFFQNCPESVMFGLCEKVSKIVSASASTEALKHYGIMLFWIAKSYPSCMDSFFIKPLLLQIQDFSQTHLQLKDSSHEELYGRLRLLANAVRGFADSQYSANILQVALAAMKETERRLYKAGSRLLRSLLEGLCSTTLGPHLHSSSNQHWNIPNSSHWNMAVKFVEQMLEYLDCSLFDKDPEELLRDEMCKERIFSAARTLHALQRGGRWLLAGAFEKSICQENEVSFSLWKGPVYAGMFGEVNRNLATELWKKVFQRILRLLEICCKYFPDNAVVLYRVLSPIEMGNEAFRFDSRLRRVVNQAKSYKQSMQASIIAKYGPNQVGKNMPSIYHRWRMESLHRKRQGYCAKGGYMEPQLTNALLQYLEEFCFSEFNKVRSRARNALTCALRLTPFHQRWTYAENMFESVQTCIASCEEEKIIACLELLQHPFLIRFFTKYYYWMKKLVFVILQSSKVSERHDVVISLSSLFGKLLSQIHPLVLSSSKQEKETHNIESKYANAKEELQSILDMLYSVVFQSESLIWNGNWKVQAFVFSLLYVFYRPECFISDEYLSQLMKYLCSEVMIVRAVVQRMVHLILQLSNIQQNEKWKQMIVHMLSDNSFELSLLRTMCQDLSVHDPNEQAAGSPLHRNMLSATTMSLASSFFSESLDAWTCWIVDGGEPWPLGYFGRPVNDLVSLRHVRLLSRLLSFVDTQTLYQIHHVALSLLDAEQLRDQIVTPKIKHLIFGEFSVAAIVNLKDDRESLQYALDWMKQLLACFVDADSLSTIETLFRLLYQLDPKCSFYQPFWEYLMYTVSNSDVWNQSSLNDARHMRTLFALVADQFPFNLQLIEQNRGSFLSAIDWLTDSNYLSHDYEQVRDEVVRLLCCFMLDDNRETLSSLTTSTKVIRRLSSILRELRNQGDIDDRGKKQLSNTRHTLSLLVYKCSYLRGPLHPLFDSRLVQIWLPLLLIAKEDSDVDVAAQTTNALSCCARCLIPSSNMESILMEICKENLHATSFKVRGGTVSFFQMWIFFHFFCLSNNVIALQECLLEYLFDESVEVREAASRSFISLACLNSMEVLETWSRRMMHILETNDKNSGTNREDDSRIRLRHGAALGASALILSQPFAILPWMPSLLVQVAYCIHDVPPISTCVRTLFSEFWRSHHDEWSKQKQMFEPEQLEAFNELLIAPSYYA